MELRLRFWRGFSGQLVEVVVSLRIVSEVKGMYCMMASSMHYLRRLAFPRIF
jgi:hypothetical protein